MKKRRIYFNQAQKPAIGVEVELFIINKDTYELYSGTPLVLKDFPESSNIKEELLESIIEEYPNIISSVINDLKKGLVPII